MMRLGVAIIRSMPLQRNGCLPQMLASRTRLEAPVGVRGNETEKPGARDVNYVGRRLGEALTELANL
jgi:hypothetical protein